jgi:hypothetical protein
MEVQASVGERDGTIAATAQDAGAAERAIIAGEDRSVSEAVLWRAGAISYRDAPGFAGCPVSPPITQCRPKDQPSCAAAEVVQRHLEVPLIVLAARKMKLGCTGRS